MIIRKPNNLYIGKAIDFLDSPHNGIVNTKDEKKVIESKYNTYISGFGGSIIQSGLLATLMIFEANDEKRKIINILFDQLNSTKYLNNNLTKTGDFYYKTINAWDKIKINQLRDELIEMAVALKLAMRCFKQIDNTK